MRHHSNAVKNLVKYGIKLEEEDWEFQADSYRSKEGLRSSSRYCFLFPVGHWMESTQPSFPQSLVMGLLVLHDCGSHSSNGNSVGCDMMHFCLFAGPSPYLGGTIGAVYFVKGNVFSCSPKILGDFVSFEVPVTVTSQM
jgi:hypothetical protein